MCDLNGCEFYGSSTRRDLQCEPALFSQDVQSIPAFDQFEALFGPGDAMTDLNGGENMKIVRIGILCAGAALVAWSRLSFASDLNVEQRTELTVFGLRAMGMNAGIRDVKAVPTNSEVEKLVSAGINLNRHLCAQITDIRPLKVRGAYEVTCIAYRGGSAKKAYLLESLKGIASEL